MKSKCVVLSFDDNTGEDAIEQIVDAVKLIRNVRYANIRELDVNDAVISEEPHHPVQPIVNVAGIARFKVNGIVRFLLENGPFDMNYLARQSFSREDHEQFAQLIGYSVGGFSDLSYASAEVIDAASAEVARRWK
jgi:hypothetical protein